MLLTRAPVATKSIATFYAAPRLACVRPVASVHPEPGSNSSLYLFFFARMIFLFFYSRFDLFFQKLNAQSIYFN